MKTLQDLKAALTAQRVGSVRMERNYPRGDHREVLVKGWLKLDPGAKLKDTKAAGKAVLAHLTEQGFVLTYDSLYPDNGEIWVQAKVSLPEAY